jgi:hypothetical protein
VHGKDAAALAPGSFVDVKLNDVVDDYDYSASLIGTVSAPGSMRRSRALPMAASHSMGSWGR